VTALYIQGWLMIVVTIFCGVRTYRDFAARNVRWGVISLLVTIAGIVVITIPVPTHAVKVDLSR
jgi:hypothetical protein